MQKIEIIEEMFKLRMEVLRVKEREAANNYFSPEEHSYAPTDGFPDFMKIAKEFSDGLLEDIKKVYEQ